ncbi:MAG: hypothetical protein GQ546_13985 [Gammaproteobacteria bacterium]|nr:hypothetical protein [Gammaproteobacteria bacterium]
MDSNSLVDVFKLYISSMFRVVAACFGVAITLVVSGTASAQDVTFGYAIAMGSVGDDSGYGVTVDGTGNVYTTGSFSGTVDFDPGAGTANLTSEGLTDIFVQKLDSAGNFVWAKSMGGVSNDAGGSIAVDTSGNVYITGSFWYTVDFDPGEGTAELTSGGQTDIFVLKLDVNGSFQWVNGMGGTSFDSSGGIAVDTSGNVYIAGTFQKYIDLDPGDGTLSPPYAAKRDIFVQKLDTDGHLVWAKTMGGTGEDYGYGIALDSSNNVYTTGTFLGTVDFDPGDGTVNLDNTGGTKIFVQKLDINGDLLWANAIGGYGAQIGSGSLGITVDGSGNVYTTGTFSNTVDFDPSVDTFELSSTGNADAFFHKMDTAGNFLWVRAVGGTDGLARGYKITVDSLGDVYAVAYYSDMVDFDPGEGISTFDSGSFGETFILKLDDSGIFEWVKILVGIYELNTGRDIAVDKVGRVYTTGSFYDTTDFDPGPGEAERTSVGSYDIFLSQLRPLDLSALMLLLLL